MTTKPLTIIANWKMNGSQALIKNMIFHLSKASISPNNEVILCPPYLFLRDLLNYLPQFSIGAQNCSSKHKEKGAFTGDISANMLKEVGCKYIILGHSERRSYYQETNDIVKQKAQFAIESNLIPIICIGETLEEKNTNKTLKIIEEQLETSLPDNANADNIIIAYEPVWAIGTGLTASNTDIETVHNYILQLLIKKFGSSFENKIKIVYGGSVKVDNAQEIISIKNVHGLLIGGISLIPEDFKRIIEL